MRIWIKISGCVHTGKRLNYCSLHRCLNWHVYQCNNQHPWKRRRRRFQSCWRAKKAETHLRHKTRSRQRCIFLHKQRERESKLSIHSKVLNWFELKLCPCLQTSLILYFLFFFFWQTLSDFLGKVSVKEVKSKISFPLYDFWRDISLFILLRQKCELRGYFFLFKTISFLGDPFSFSFSLQNHFYLKCASGLFKLSVSVVTLVHNSWLFHI